MDLIKKYTGNKNRYNDYLNGKGDFFFVQDAEDESIECPLYETPFKEIYNINMEEIVPSTYGMYITIHGDKGPLFESTYQEYSCKLWPEIDYKRIGVDETDKWGNNIKETYQKNHPRLFKNISKTSYVYKIVDAFVYRSPMVPICEFNGSRNHPYSFVPLCCLETWEDSSTSDIEVLHKRTKDYFENEIMLLNHKNTIHKLEQKISELNKTIHIMKNDMQDDFINKLNDEINDVSFVQFKHKIEIVTMIGVLLSLFIKIII